MIGMYVPVEGLLQMWAYKVDPAEQLRRLGSKPTVSILLEKDGDLVGTVWYDWTDGEVNERAKRITGLLGNAFVEVRGGAFFEGLTEDQAVQVIQEVT